MHTCGRLKATNTVERGLEGERDIGGELISPTLSQMAEGSLLNLYSLPYYQHQR